MIRAVSLAALTLLVLDALLIGWWFVTSLLSSREYETGVAVKLGLYPAAGVLAAAMLLVGSDRQSFPAGVVLALLMAVVPVGYIYLWRPLHRTVRLERAMNAKPQYQNQNAQKLVLAIEAQDEAAVRTLVAQGVDWKSPAEQGGNTTIFGQAVVATLEKPLPMRMLQLLVELGAGVNSGVIYGGPLLKGVLLFGNRENAFEVMQFLLNNGAEVNPAGESAAPLPHAGFYPKLVELLLAHGANVNSEDYGYSAVYRFASSRHWDTALMLVKAGADLNYVEPDGGTLERQIEVCRGSGDDAALDALSQAIAERRRKRSTKP